MDEMLDSMDSPSDLPGQLSAMFCTVGEYFEKQRSSKWDLVEGITLILVELCLAILQTLLFVLV